MLERPIGPLFANSRIEKASFEKSACDILQMPRGAIGHGGEPLAFGRSPAACRNYRAIGTLPLGARGDWLQNSSVRWTWVVSASVSSVCTYNSANHCVGFGDDGRCWRAFWSDQC